MSEAGKEVEEEGASLKQVSSLLACAMPTAYVNLLFEENVEDGEESAVAIEVRPRSRLFKSFPVPPAKWTVAVFRLKPDCFTVYILHMDRKIHEEREFGSAQAQQLVDFVKGHPILNERLVFCQGIGESASSSSLFSVDHCGGKVILRSTTCEMLIQASEESTKCKFCAKVCVGESNGDTESEYRKPARMSKPGRKRTSPVWDYFTNVERELTECNLCHDSVRCPKSQTSSMISHLQNFHPEEYSEMLLKTSQKVKAEAKGIFSEEVEDALERIEVKPEVKIEEDFEEEEDAEGNNDEDYMGGISYDSDDSDNNPLVSKKRGPKRKSRAHVDFETDVKKEGDDEEDPDFKIQGDANSAAYEKPKPGRKRSSPVWDYFTSVEKDLTSCNLCGATVRCPKSGTSTMIHHLQSAHPGEYGEMLMKTSQKVKSEANKASSLDLGELKKQYEENKGKKSKSSSETKPRKPRKKYARTAAAKSYQCESCGKTFEHKQGWARHMQKHVGEPGVEIPEFKKVPHKKWLCPICAWHGWEAAKYGHMAHQHKIFLKQKHACDICGKVLWQKHALRDHMMIHTGEKPFQCTHCGKSFRTRSGLRICQNRCTGRYFECRHCGRKFTDKARMVVHERIHTGEKPYTCKICNSSYPSNSSLSTHVSRHHNTTLTALHKEESEAQEEQEQRGLSEHSVYREGQRGRPPKFS